MLPEIYWNEDDRKKYEALSNTAMLRAYSEMQKTDKNISLPEETN